MSRDLTAEILATLTDDVVYPFFAVELLFDNNPVRVWTGVGTISLNGFDWTGTGNLLSISAIEETQEMSVKGATLTMSGIPSSLLSLALSEPYQGRVCNIYFGTSQVAIELSQIFSGYMDQMNISDGPDTATIEMRVENKLIDLERARVARYTSGYQKSVYPADLGLDFVESLQDKDIVWGRATTSGSGFASSAVNQVAF